ncbi:unnamed protein product [Macrosiphum euphorbiae]|uniref:Uncharacterized protein n=1 Tax=Macrosiphum euphorbiae TaxID=13131 RepID=A0AAV0WRA4_9HEMI|nr:unnamed protein product [Macrosiphum euphorbiae]
MRLDTDDDSCQDSGSEYLPYYLSNRSSSSDEVDSKINDDFNNEITQEVDNNEIIRDTALNENTEPTNLKTLNETFE